MKSLPIKKLMNLYSSLLCTSNYNRICEHRWSDVRDLVAKGIPKSKLIKFEWHGINSYKNNDKYNYYPIKLDDLSLWSTYDNSDCISLKYYIKDKKLLCDAIISNGSFMDGSFKERKFSCTIQLPNKFIKELESSIMNKLNREADNAYDLFLENQRTRYKTEFINDYLKLI